MSDLPPPKVPKKASKANKTAADLGVEKAAQSSATPRKRRSVGEDTATPATKKATATKSSATQPPKAASQSTPTTFVYTPPAPVPVPRPPYASGPTQSDYIGLGVLILVVVLAVTLYWFNGPTLSHATLLKGPALSINLPLDMAHWPKMTL